MNGATTTKTFTVTPTPGSDCGTSTFEYQVTYTPSSTTADLITLSTSNVGSIQFAQSSNIADAQQYTVTVKARIVGSNDWLTPIGTAAATYTYVHPCTTTSIIAPSLTTMTTSVLKRTSHSDNPFYVTQTEEATNSVSNSQNDPNYCGSY